MKCRSINDRHDDVCGICSWEKPDVSQKRGHGLGNLSPLFDKVLENGYIQKQSNLRPRKGKARLKRRLKLFPKNKLSKPEVAGKKNIQYSCQPILPSILKPDGTLKKEKLKELNLGHLCKLGEELNLEFDKKTKRTKLLDIIANRLVNLDKLSPGHLKLNILHSPRLHRGKMNSKKNK